MSAKIYIPGGTQVIPQPDFQAFRESDNGAWLATQSFWIVKGALNSAVTRAYFGIGKSITQLDPNAAAIWSFLSVRKISTSVIPGGWEVVTVEFGGVPSVDGQGNPINAPDEFSVTYSMRGQTSDAPFQDHPKWKQLSDIEKNALGKIASGDFIYGPDFDDPEEFRTFRGGEIGFEVNPDPIQSDDAKEFAKLLAQGLNTYRAAGFTWSKRWAATAPLSSGQLNQLGKITTPPGGPPTPGSGRNWLLVSANFEQTGDTSSNPSYTNEIVFELSQEGGWDSFLHG